MTYVEIPAQDVEPDDSFVYRDVWHIVTDYPKTYNFGTVLDIPVKNDETGETYVITHERGEYLEVLRPRRRTH